MSNQATTRRLQALIVISAALAATPAFAQTPEEFCEELENRAKASAIQGISDIYESPFFKNAEAEINSATNCQLSQIGELSSWVTGGSNFGFLSVITEKLSAHLSKKLCEEIGKRTRDAMGALGSINSILSKIPTSIDDIESMAVDFAIDYGKKAIDKGVKKVADKLPKPDIPVIPGFQIPGLGNVGSLNNSSTPMQIPGITEMPNLTPGTALTPGIQAAPSSAKPSGSQSDPWNAIRSIYQSN